MVHICGGQHGLHLWRKNVCHLDVKIILRDGTQQSEICIEERHKDTRHYFTCIPFAVLLISFHF